MPGRSTSRAFSRLRMRLSLQGDLPPWHHPRDSNQAGSRFQIRTRGRTAERNNPGSYFRIVLQPYIRFPLHKYRSVRRSHRGRRISHRSWAGIRRCISPPGSRIHHRHSVHSCHRSRRCHIPCPRSLVHTPLRSFRNRCRKDPLNIAHRPHHNRRGHIPCLRSWPNRRWCMFLRSNRPRS